MDRSIGIVVPAYEPDVSLLQTYVEAIEKDLGPAEIQIELDDPDGNVAPELESLDATVSVSPTRRGKGAAITHGFEALNTDVFAFVDADGSTPVHSLKAVLDPVVDGDCSLAVGSRRHPTATVRTHQTIARRWLGNGFAWLARRILSVPLYDFQCGAKAIDATVWSAVRNHIYEPGFAWDLELIVMTDAFGYEIEEVPIKWEDQPGSTVSPVGTSLSLAIALFVVRHRAKRLEDNRLHTAIQTYREDPTALVDRRKPNDD